MARARWILPLRGNDQTAEEWEREKSMRLLIGIRNILCSMLFWSG